MLGFKLNHVSKRGPRDYSGVSPLDGGWTPLMIPENVLMMTEIHHIPKVCSNKCISMCGCVNINAYLHYTDMKQTGKRQNWGYTLLWFPVDTLMNKTMMINHKWPAVVQGLFCVCAQPMMLRCHVVSHWLGAYIKWSLVLYEYFYANINVIHVTSTVFFLN